MTNSLRVFIILTCSLYFALNATATTIRCTNAEYANEKLTFYAFADPISNNNKVAFTLTFNSEGTSQATLQTDAPVFTFSEFGIYRGMLLVEPGKTIDLKLPPLKKKSFADQKIPTFNPFRFGFIPTTAKCSTTKSAALSRNLTN